MLQRFEPPQRLLEIYLSDLVRYAAICRDMAESIFGKVSLEAAYFAIAQCFLFLGDHTHTCTLAFVQLMRKATACCWMCMQPCLRAPCLSIGCILRDAFDLIHKIRDALSQRWMSIHVGKLVSFELRRAVY